MFSQNLQAKVFKIAIPEGTIHDRTQSPVHAFHETIRHALDKVIQDFRPPVGERAHEL